MLAGTRFTDSAASEFHPLWLSFKAGLYSPKDSVSTVMTPLACWEHSDVSLIISGGPCLVKEEAQRREKPRAVILRTFQYSRVNARLPWSSILL